MICHSLHTFDTYESHEFALSLPAASLSGTWLLTRSIQAAKVSSKQFWQHQILRKLASSTNDLIWNIISKNLSTVLGFPHVFFVFSSGFMGWSLLLWGWHGDPGSVRAWSRRRHDSVGGVDDVSSGLQQDWIWVAYVGFHMLPKSTLKPKVLKRVCGPRNQCHFLPRLPCLRC